VPLKINHPLDTRQRGAIILAAGEAKRFGSPKQLLVWKGQTLVERAVHACLEVGCDRIVVVTGAHASAIQLSLKLFEEKPNVSVTLNPNWSAGMHTSIACGLKALLRLEANLHSTFVLAVDQPLIDAYFLQKLYTAKSGHDAAALTYPSGPGVPACFGESLFTQLINLATKGHGAKAILRDPTVNTALVNDPKRRQDIDTLADWNDFKRTSY